MCNLATELSWHEAQTAAVGEIRILLDPSPEEPAVLTVVPWMPLAVAESHKPVN